MYSSSTAHDRAFRAPERPEVPEFGTVTGDLPSDTPMITTHRVTYSDRLKVFIGPSETVQNFLRPLRRLDGHDRYSLCMTRLPAPMRSRDIPTTPITDRGTDYLHCMGSVDGLILELRTTVDGHPYQCLLGSGSLHSDAPTVHICAEPGQRPVEVYPDEVFTAEQAAEIFTTYYRTGEVPLDLTRREWVLR
ncbi:hypothetical protein D5S18_00170 [Nocardia panacis]|uniref:Uncharacterized protein n=1 Tax=Nocardia panacis TaxID=2340916 RepID=A0A3A4KV22_9NOCA|nr:hypothetical protein [Nocardia panacis]RJO80376.1 hypothetical protein D5S18_00170 [Nocardia panacis]